MHRFVFTTRSVEKRSTSASFTNRLSRQAHIGMSRAHPCRDERLGECAETYGCVRDALQDYMEAEVGRFEHCDCVCDEKEIAGEKPLVRDRALVFSPRAPFAFVTKIPKNANKNAGDTAFLP